MIKVLLFSDVHVSRHFCEQLVTASKEVDLVIGAGDFGALRRGLEQTVGWLSGIDKPTVLVPGNAESYEELALACRQWEVAQVLHGSGCELMGWSFYGIGGGIPITPFGSWSYDFSESEALQLLEDCPLGGILVSHSPPFGILDLSSRGQHLGSTAVLKALQSKKPKLLVCGHIHESSGQQQVINGTLVVNAGPQGLVIDL